MRDRPAESELPVLWCDGGSRGNPGPAAIGFVLIDDGVVLAEGGHPIGVATAALAEYRAVLAGLTAALDARSTRSRCAPTRACWLRTCGARRRFEASRSRCSRTRSDRLRRGSRCCSTAGCLRPRTAPRIAWRSWPCVWREARARREREPPPTGGARSAGGGCPSARAHANHRRPRVLLRLLVERAAGQEVPVPQVGRDVAQHPSAPASNWASATATGTPSCSAPRSR